MKLAQVLEKHLDTTMIALGARSSFLMIAPKAELVEWLKKEDKRVKKENQYLRQLNKKHGTKIPMVIPFSQREVKRESLDKSVHHGWIIVIEGDEQGRYAVRSEVTGIRPDPRLKSLDTECGRELLNQIVAIFVNDITVYWMCQNFYSKYHQSLGVAGKRRMEQALIDYRTAVTFFEKPDLYEYTSIPGEKLIFYGRKNACYKIQDTKRIAIMQSAREGKMDRLYTEEELEKIIDLHVLGYGVGKILERVGHGKENKATVEMVEEYISKYERKLKKEAMEFFHESGLMGKVKIKEQLHG